LQLLRLVLQRNNKPGPTPNLEVVTVHQLFGFGDRLLIVVANQRLEPDKVAVNSNGVNPILCHMGGS
jgi:hypothetical protein